MADHTQRNTLKGLLVRGSTLGAGVVLAAALLLIVNYLGFKYFERFDWTGEEIYTLSEKSEKILAELDQPVEVVAFLVPTQAPSDALHEPIRELLARYEAASDEISVRYVDPAKNPAEAETLVSRYGVERENVILFVSGDDRRVLNVGDLAELDFSGAQFGQAPEIKSFKGEQAFTGAILELVQERKPRVLFTTGHGELALDDTGQQGLSTIQEILGKDNVQIESWASQGADSVPEDADLVVIAGPTGSFVPPELEMLGAYLERGGRLLVLLDPTFSRAEGLIETGLAPWLAGYGIEVGQDIVLDPANPIPFFGAESLFVSSFGDHPTTRTVSGDDISLIVSLARSVGKAAGDGEGVTELLRTSTDGWGERNLEEVTTSGEVDRDEEDVAGPVSLGVAVERPVDGDTGEASGGEDAAGDGESGEAAKASEEPERTMRLVVLGDSDLATNRLVRAYVGNQVLLSDTLNWLVEREVLLGIPPKEPEQVRLSLSVSELRWVYVLVLVVLPGTAILLGALLYIRRRR